MALPAFAMPPRVQVTVIVPLHEPWLALAEPKITFGGRVLSVTTAFVGLPRPTVRHTQRVGEGRVRTEPVRRVGVRDRQIRRAARRQHPGNLNGPIRVCQSVLAVVT